MKCDLCNEDFGNVGYAVIVKPSPFHGHKECMQIIDDIAKTNLGLVGFQILFNKKGEGK